MKTMFKSNSIGGLLGLGLVLAGAVTGMAQNPVTFQVDMTSQPGATDVFVRGSFNGWGTANQLTNNGSGVYTGTVNIADSPGTVEACKFYFNPGDTWEGDPNRQFVLAAGGQTLPLTSWNVKDWPTPNNNVTFRVDMTAQVLTRAFTNGVDEVRVSGAFNGWGAGDLLTNNPALAGNASNIHSKMLSISGFPNSAGPEYKFRSKGGWESPASTGGNNRTWQIAGGDQVLPLVYYNDLTPCDLLQADTAVTFVLHMTNGTTSADGGIVFDRSVNHLYLNGEFLGWWTWDTGFGGSEGPQYEMTNNPVGSDFFQQTFTIPAGKSLATTYKYSIDGFDNEAGFAVNHVRYIRGLSGVPFTMPVDRFGTNGGPPLIESSFGDLGVSSPSGGYIPITWSGRQCVTLQTKDTIAGSWQNIPATEGTSATNWPNTGGAQFFRLQKTP